VKKKTSDYGLGVDFFSNISNLKAKKVYGYGYCQIYMLVMIMIAMMTMIMMTIMMIMTMMVTMTMMMMGA